MKYLMKGNRLPNSYTFNSLSMAMDEADVSVIGVGNKTEASKILYDSGTGEVVIEIQLHGHTVVRLYENGTLRLFDCGFFTKTTKKRMNAALMGIGKHLVAVNRRTKIYTISTGDFEKYFDGMVVSK